MSRQRPDIPSPRVAAQLNTFINSGRSLGMTNTHRFRILVHLDEGNPSAVARLRGWGRIGTLEARARRSSSSGMTQWSSICA
jgi:hypothetical protein